MCNSRCASARSPRSKCRCSCGGANHGGGYSVRYPKHRGGLFVRQPPIFVPLPRPKPPSTGDYLKSIGKSALTSAVIYGLSAAAPPLGAVAIPAYTAYNYSKLGYGLYKIYAEISVERKVSPNSLKEASGSLGDLVAQGPADTIASALVARASQSGLFAEMTKNTHVEDVVIAEMMRGSTSSALSSGAGELAKFAIRKAVGA